MPRRVLIFDTSVLCCLLRVPGKASAGSGEDRWDHDKISSLIREESSKNSTFVLPLASIIETGNHIAQSSGDRFGPASDLCKIILSSINAETPWAAFTEQNELWGIAQLTRLTETWPEYAKSKLSIGDATIKEVAEFYARGNFEVEIVTGDKGLKAYEPEKPAKIPRRRR